MLSVDPCEWKTKTKQKMSLMLTKEKWPSTFFSLHHFYSNHRWFACFVNAIRRRLVVFIDCVSVILFLFLFLFCVHFSSDAFDVCIKEYTGLWLDAYRYTMYVTIIKIKRESVKIEFIWLSCVLGGLGVRPWFWWMNQKWFAAYILFVLLSSLSLLLVRMRRVTWDRIVQFCYEKHLTWIAIHSHVFIIQYSHRERDNNSRQFVHKTNAGPLVAFSANYVWLFSCSFVNYLIFFFHEKSVDIFLFGFVFGFQFALTRRGRQTLQTTFQCKSRK